MRSILLIATVFSLLIVTSCEKHNKKSSTTTVETSDKNSDVFLKLCKNNGNPKEVSVTIEALKKVANSTDCDKANEYFSKTVEINLSGNNISNILPLTGFKILTVLDLSNNQIASIEGLSKLRNLIKLNLEKNKIKEIGELVHLANLEDINLTNNLISSIYSLKNLSKVREFKMMKNFLGDGGIEKNENNCPVNSASKAISNWCQPPSLFLKYCLKGPNEEKEIIKTVEAIKKVVKKDNCYDANMALKKAEKLDLTLKQITDLAPLRGLQNLRILDLSYNFIEDLGPIANLSNLTELYLYSNKIKSVSSLTYLEKLNTLNLSLNYITDIYPLKNLKHLDFNQSRRDHEAFLIEFNPLGCKDDELTKHCFGEREPVGKTEYNCPKDSDSNRIVDWCDS